MEAFKFSYAQRSRLGDPAYNKTVDEVRLIIIIMKSKTPERRSVIHVIYLAGGVNCCRTCKKVVLNQLHSLFNFQHIYTSLLYF